ncbi:sigma-70 family RNA polymerase sigma factor [Pseudacidobacterium ailaaui]|jgi:RNA polymerase sigma-70 factor (ECF subfamily)|uniref:sigma-70 family RNA polymerase sigma factor n=1 Tax=Pseudacidobacterium ailaaui TaxID=1382359 RepID=UPI0009E0053C|nr:sigma-70 family RNA polymerase sigma factor [Pseudacidobacterium ailaaui]
MMADMEDTAAAVFDPLRPQLVRVAYRMLGSVADAEDVVQEAFLRWLEADRSAVQQPEAFLRCVVTRLCLDYLKSARVRRETYLGPWLPEPVVELAEQADNVTLPLLMALERLSPLERAAFVLHDLFGLSFEEIGHTISRDPAACRQLASRARAHVREARPRFPISKSRCLEIADAFFAATRGGNMEKLRSLLAEDVVVYSDGGGKVPALLEPVVGIENVMPLFESLARVFEREMSRMVQQGFINGLPGFVTVESNNTLQTTALEVDADKISAIYVVRNPEKLEHIRVLISGAGEQSRV